MWNLFCANSNTVPKEEAKTFILKEFFNSANQKKAVVRAARESAEDQKELLEKYNREVRKQ